MNKKKIMIVGAAAILLIAAFIGGTMAAFQAQTTSANKISAGNIGIKLMEKTTVGDAEVAAGNVQTAAKMPGDVFPKEIYATNTKDNELYLRVTLHKYWEDGKGVKNPKGDAAFIKILTHKQDKWIIQDNDPNSEEIYFYYKEPVQPGENTDNIMDAIQIDNISSKDQGIYAGLSIGYELEADAIQILGAQDAMLSEWGLEVNIGQNKIIQAVEEQ